MNLKLRSQQGSLSPSNDRKYSVCAQRTLNNDTNMDKEAMSSLREQTDSLETSMITESLLTETEDEGEAYREEEELFIPSGRLSSARQEVKRSTKRKNSGSSAALPVNEDLKEVARNVPVNKILKVHAVHHSLDKPNGRGHTRHHQHHHHKTRRHKLNATLDKRVQQSMAKYEQSIISTSIQAVRELQEIKLQRKTNLRKQVAKKKLSYDSFQDQLSDLS